MTQTQSEKKAEAEEQERTEVSFGVLAAVIAEVKAAGLTFREYLATLEQAVSDATRKLELAQSVANLCTATKTRKPRADKGNPRSAKKGQGRDGGGESSAATNPESQQ